MLTLGLRSPAKTDNRVFEQEGLQGVLGTLVTNLAELTPTDHRPL